MIAWRRIGVLAENTVLNYSTKRGYRVALQQNTSAMKVDVELEEAGYNSKTRAKFFNRIWHPYLPRKVSAMQWLILTEGLPVGAWRERVGLPNTCQLCPQQLKETLQHAFQECSEIARTWVLFHSLRQVAGLPPSYCTWKEISRGLLTDPPGPSVEENLRWDTAAAFTITADTPWDILRANLLWAIWCARVGIAYREEDFYLGSVLWHAWRNTIYCAMEAYKELFRHARNEEKRQELISCFQKVWTQAEIFGRMRGGVLKWNLTPHPEFLPADLGAWNSSPIRMNRPSPSPDPEAEFSARPDLPDLIDEFLNGINNSQIPQTDTHPNADSNEYQEAGPLVVWVPDGVVTPTTGADTPQHRSAPTVQPAGRQPPVLQPHSAASEATYSSQDTGPLINEVPSEIDNCSRAQPGTPHRNKGRPTHSESPERNTRSRSHSILLTQNLQANSNREERQSPHKRKPTENKGKENQEAYLVHKDRPSKSRPKRMCLRKKPQNNTVQANRSSPPVPRSTPPIRSPEPCRPKSRPKKRCCFGPRKIQPEVRTRCDAARVHQGSPVHFPHHLDRSQIGGHEPQSGHVLPSITTLTPPYSSQRSLVARYKGKEALTIRPPPYRFLCKQFGLTETEFEDKIVEEIDDMLQEIEHERRQALLETLPFERVLSKEECRRMLEASQTPLTGSQLGVLRWASEPDERPQSSHSPHTAIDR